MARRYLFGPAPVEFIDRYLRQDRQAGACLAFNDVGAGDLVFPPEDTWESLCTRLPTDWRPDLVVVWPRDGIVPASFRSAPVPLVAWAPDWEVHWHSYRLCLRSCERVLTDRRGARLLAREGILQARAAHPFPPEQAFLEREWPPAPRDIDVLFIGTLPPTVERERFAWLGRLAHWGERWRVVFCNEDPAGEYRELLGRARIVCQAGAGDEWPGPALEAVAAGALLLLHDPARSDSPDVSPDRQDCVLTNNDNLGPVLEYYLEHEDRRRERTQAARARVRHDSFENLWQEQLGQIDRDWPELVRRAGRRPPSDPRDYLLCRIWRAPDGGPDSDPTLVADLLAALQAQPQSPVFHNALGVTFARAAHGPRAAARAEQAFHHFRRALAESPSFLVSGLNLAEALAAAGQTTAAVEAAKSALAILGRLTQPPEGILDACPPSPVGGGLRAEWERAAWSHAGDRTAEGQAKCVLLRWRLQMLLAELTGELSYSYEAVLARPDLPRGRADLGKSLARSGRPREAAAHLRRALAEDPFDCGAARALYQVLQNLGDTASQSRLARERRLLAAAAPQAVPGESWFVAVSPGGDDLVSVLIPCYNQVDYTRLCLESVLCHTRPPYEFVLLDNGSTDETPAYLETIRSRPGPARVEVIRNEQNRGFPAACNQALARAHGRYVVFLNNDTVVAEGWLEGLLAWARQDRAAVGLVGPVTNCSRPPQQVPTDYDPLDGLAAFAARRRREYAGRALEVERLTGFCLLARRDVLDRIGGFDERYGLGFFDDDDLSVRARQAGFRLLVVQDVFVHHFGSRTFTALGIDCRAQLRENFERFRAKWGEEHAAGYRLPEGPTAVAANVPLTGLEGGTGPRPRVSLCLIVKDEEANLPDCLGSAADLVDEVIVVDTGSSDLTREVAARFGARVVDFPWVDSFAAARNESLDHATGEWIFWLDADDRLDEVNRRKLRALFDSLCVDNAAYAMKCLCLPDPAAGATTLVDHIRLFRNDPRVRWQYRVHEQILPAVRRTGGEVCWTEVVIRHTGYQNADVRCRKRHRDLRLLRLDLAEHPDDPFILFNLGSVLIELGQTVEAVAALRQSLERSQPTDSIVRKLYALIVQCHRQLGQAGEARAAWRAGRALYPEDAELLFQEGLLRHEEGDGAGAEAAWLRLLGTEERPHFASVDTGLRGYKARHNVALLYREQGRHREAEAQWQAALAEQPDFLPALLGLAELYLVQQRWPELDRACERLPDLAPWAAEAGVLRARGHLARGEMSAARELLRTLVTRHPRALGPRVVLSQALLQEGRDWEAAERALLDVLTLAPDHAEARHNLTVLRRQHRVPADGSTA
jgi:GT2 family glycosyltransferase/tetratricopeptide (TPR) repeat protein